MKIGTWGPPTPSIKTCTASQDRKRPRYALVLAADHIYKMNYARMVAQHVRSGAEITVGTIQEKAEQAYRFGVVEVDRDGRVTGFEEKPAAPQSRSPYNPEMISASMGIYVFNTQVLVEALRQDAEDCHLRSRFRP